MPQKLLDTCHFHVEVTLDTTGLDQLNNCVKTLSERRKILVQSLHV